MLCLEIAVDLSTIVDHRHQLDSANHDVTSAFLSEIADCPVDLEHIDPSKSAACDQSFLGSFICRYAFVYGHVFGSLSDSGAIKLQLAKVAAC